MEYITEWFKVITLCFAGYFLGNFVYNKVVAYVKNTYDKNIYNGYVKFYIVVCSIAGVAFSLEHLGISI